MELNDYCARKGFPNPLAKKGAPVQNVPVPQYNPGGMPAPLMIDPQPMYMMGMAPVMQVPTYNYVPPMVNNLPPYQPPQMGEFHQQSQYPSMMPPPAMHVPSQPQSFDHQPPMGGGPSYQFPNPSINDDDNQSVSSVDDFEARLAALKQL